jgi:hypothetical protein
MKKFSIYNLRKKIDLWFDYWFDIICQFAISAFLITVAILTIYLGARGIYK